MSPSDLSVRRVGIDTYAHPVVYLHQDCPLVHSEGFSAPARLEVALPGRSIVATLNVVCADWLPTDVAGLSESAWQRLAPSPGERAVLRHPPPPASASALRAKVFGRELDAAQLRQLIDDVVHGRLSELELAAFVTACAGERLSIAETIALTRAMVEVGERLDWGRTPVLDKHGVGGLPGNRTTPIVVAILAAMGLTVPKTSSRAITSPAGTADAMETVTEVALDLPRIRRVVEREGGCLVWGGAVRLSPADDLLIRVERPLDFDSDGQLVASVLSKKIAAGSTHVVIDLPIGPTAKVRSPAAAEALERRLTAVADAFGLRLALVRGDGRQPIGRGIGPALEARDVLAVLRGAPEAPADLRERALVLAAALVELAGLADAQAAAERTRAVLDDGRAWRKFVAICQAQGRFSTPPVAPFRHEVGADRAGVVHTIDNRRLAKLAKLAGAPMDPAAGVDLRVGLGQTVERGQPLFVLHAETRGELDYALEYHAAQHGVIVIGEP